LKKNYTHLKKISLFAHYEGVQWEPGRDGTLTRMVRVIDSWWWIIPLNNNRTSVGVVLDAAKFKSSKLSPEEFFERAVAEQTVVADRIGNGRRVTEVDVAADFSYRMRRLAGDEWLLAGEGAGFVEAVFRRGVLHAMFDGC